MTSVIDHLSPDEKRARLAALLRASDDGGNDHPVSYGQAAMMHLHELAPDSVAYNTMWSADVRGPIDPPRLRQAFAAVVDRHGVLRSTFHWRDGEPRQAVHPNGDVDFTVVDSGGWTAAALDHALVADAERPFDLSRGPVVRLTLYSSSARDHVVLCSAHHVAVDYWSLVILMDELQSIYTALQAGVAVPLSPPASQYIDHARWQREFLSGPAGSRLWEHWRRALDGECPQLSLPIDKPRPAVQSFRGAAHGFPIEPALLERLRVLALARSTTLYTVCLAAFDVLLHRYTGDTDILVGSPMAGRTAARSEGAIGYFANTIVLRARCGDNPRFTDFLADVSRTVLDALDGQDYPFPLLVENLKIGLDRSRAPVCDVLFSWDKPHYRHRPAAPAGLVFEPREIRQLGSTHDLATICFERGDRCDCVIQYSTDLFEAATIARMAKHYTNLLNAVVVAPDERIGQLALLNEAEQHALAGGWNDTTTAYPSVPVPILFDQQVLRTPEAIALEFADVTLSYRELDRRSSRLASFLRRRGVGRGTVVAVCMERSVDFVVALLGVIKAGAAYLPLDPSYPADRLRFMFDDSNAIVLLAHRATASRLPDRQPILVDDEAFEAGRLIDDLVAAGTTADDVVYVMYTSGSTGQPKGISIPHRAVVRLVRNTNYIAITASDRIGHASNTSFDALTFEVWGALLNGATLVEMPRETILSSRALAAHLRTAGISVMFLTTALVNQMALEMPDGFASLRCLLFGGEACDPNLVRAIVESGRPRQLVHVYGPTESTTFATSFRIDDVAPGAATVPIGMPISNTCLYLLDSHMQLVPIGVIGEVYLGGDGLALEYRGRPELTADRFVPNPFQPAARLYRTGDLARRLPDGNVVFVGRRDQQVKIRGFRIELGEIEAALRSHADVGDALVVSPGAGIDKRLVAFVASQRVPAPTSLELRAYLQQRLPDYMVPGQIVVRNGLPLTANGKVDRRALHDAAVATVGLDDDFVPAGTETEQRLARLWATALGTDDVGIHSDFFALGGHSLLATRLVSTIRLEFDVALPLTALFDAPTVAAMAATVDRLRGERQERLRAEILASLDGMSDDQVEAALARLNGQSSTE